MSEPLKMDAEYEVGKPDKLTLYFNRSITFNELKELDTLFQAYSDGRVSITPAKP